MLFLMLPWKQLKSLGDRKDFETARVKVNSKSNKDPTS